MRCMHHTCSEQGIILPVPGLPPEQVYTVALRQVGQPCHVISYTKQAFAPLILAMQPMCVYNACRVQ